MDVVIALLADAMSPHTVNLATQLAERHKVILISRHHSVGFDMTNIIPVTIDCGYGAEGILRAVPIVKKALKEYRVDILESLYLTKFGYIGVLTGFHPFMAGVLGSDLIPSSLTHKLATAHTLAKADAIITPSYACDRFLTDRQLRKTQVIYPGVDMDIFKPLASEAFRPTIGTVKGLLPIYGIEYLIQALPELISSFRNLRVLIIGGGVREPYEKLAKKLGVDSFIDFTGKIPHQQVPSYLAKMDVFVMPTVYESFGVAALEAQAMEIPVVASKVGGIPEAVCDGQTGILVEPENPHAIAEAVITLLRDDTLREKMGKRGREFVLKNFTWRRNIACREQLYSTLLKRRGTMLKLLHMEKRSKPETHLCPVCGKPVIFIKKHMDCPHCMSYIVLLDGIVLDGGEA